MWIIDRFEGEYAVIEHGGVTFNVPRCALPEEAGEGDVLRVIADNELTLQRKQNIKKLFDKLADGDSNRK